MDESGIAMWEETLGPSTTADNLQDWAHFMRYQLQQLDEMQEASMNHPSIMAWGFFNEGPSDNASACPAYAACAAQLAARDPTRFQTWASNKRTTDKCLEHASMISFNDYPGWYGAGREKTPHDAWTASASFARANHPRKPFIISETGAGGLYEWSDNTTDVMWSLTYQTEILALDIEVALSNVNISGVSLWHFFDFKADDDAQACGPCQYLPNVTPPTCGWYNMTPECSLRPGGVNHKGVVDFYRRVKPAFALASAKFGRAKQAHGQESARRSPEAHEIII
ncbi:unnamed protein product [Polarella glacialis]|uniref:Glycoside hydrolase family 2 catalytic domain-containing protein n=1 Tax=Polarella glacialis TaxID=89957 RepID=A0A813DD88_POLGL|nr:unnamed protein product [Polarella glacialis]